MYILFTIHIFIYNSYIFCSPSTQIYEQVMNVIRHLYCISALRVVGLICDGASEHSKFFRTILDGVSTEDASRTISFEHPCDSSTIIFAISDVPHITKKGRGSLFRSGTNSWSTRRMLWGKTGDTVHDGDLMTWDPFVWVHEERNKKNAAGQQRCKCFDIILLYIVLYSNILITHCFFNV